MTCTLKTYFGAELLNCIFSGFFQKDKPKLHFCVSRILKIGLQFEFFVQTVATGGAYLDLFLVIKTQY